MNEEINNKIYILQTKYDKKYTGILEKRRKAIWLHNCKKILKHNQEAKQGKYNFTLSANTLSDMVKMFFTQNLQNTYISVKINKLISF